MAPTAAGEVWLVRHGQTEWARTGRHTSITDVPLTATGEAEARALRVHLARVPFELVLTSPRARARMTARLAGYPDAVVDEDLQEWRYGAYEGLTTERIHAHDPDWTIWEGGGPGGETPADVTRRLDRFIERVRDVAGPVLCFGHGHALRALAARWVGRPVTLGAALALDPGGTCVLGADPGVPQLLCWNLAPAPDARDHTM